MACSLARSELGSDRGEVDPVGSARSVSGAVSLRRHSGEPGDSHQRADRSAGHAPRAREGARGSTKHRGLRKTVLITGASGGIGYEFARLFARDGYALILVARSKDKLKAVADELERHHGSQVRVLPKDLSRPQAPSEL